MPTKTIPEQTYKMIARYATALFFSVGLVVLPVVTCWLSVRLLPKRRGLRVGLACACIIICVTLWGATAGVSSLTVRHVEFASSELPEAFDGYRIVQFSDAHVGSYTGWRKKVLQRNIDSINAQHADMVVFTGDMQNVWPDELAEHTATMRRLAAPDGVFAVLGNHDYAVYQNCDSAEKMRNCEQTVDGIRRMGFDLLLNEHRMVRRGTDSIVVAGMENWGITKRMPRRGDVRQTLSGLAVSDSDGQAGTDGVGEKTPFVVMLQHDPTAWREHILPESSAQLTLSGHTHGAQMSLFGWSPASMMYGEWGGMTVENGRAINVSTGMGALIPWRLGLPPEIVVITLKKLKN